MARTQFRCTECGDVSPVRKMACANGHIGSWEQFDAPAPAKATAAANARAYAASAVAAGTAGKLVRLGDVTTEARTRVKTGIEEFDRAAGGGLMPASLVLIAGAPGEGKSTILAQVVDALVQQGYGAIYASGEESAGQIRERAERLKLHLNDIRVVTEQDANVICEIISTEHPQFCVIDSIQTFSPSVDAPAGTISSVQRVAHMFLKTAKAAGTTLLIVGQINKDSNIAGPEALQHLVDTVLFLEGDKNGFLRILRATKNRFGPLDEIGLFDMREEGMVGISAPAPLHLEGGEAYGRCVCPAMEGTRAILVEVQALVAKAAYGTARRVAIGVPAPRVAMLLAVLERYAKIDLSNHDVYVQISGGISVNEPGIDLAVCAAIASSYWSHPLPRDSVSLGEVGLGGELRPVRQITSRIKEATRQGFNLVVGPKADNLPAGAYRAFSDIAAALGALDVLAPKDGEPVKGGMPLRTRAAIMMRNKRDGSDND